jgi:peptidoglycan/LPS O-acetylase OafA/YrhL
MPLFFVLSGFVIHYNYRRLFLASSVSRGICEFAVARFARLYPLYICLLALSIIVDQLVVRYYDRPDAFFGILALDLTLTQSWFYVLIDGQLPLFAILGPAWSISTEMFFYVAYVPLVFLILKLSAARSSVVTAAAGAVLTLMISVFVLYAAFHPESIALADRHISLQDNPPNSFFVWLFQFSPYTLVFQFLVGCLTANTVVLISDRPPSGRECKLAAIGLTISLLWLIGLAVIQFKNLVWPVHLLFAIRESLTFACAAPMAFIIFYVARYPGLFTRLVSSKILVRLGDTSYSIYLVHALTLRIFFRSPSEFPASTWDTVARILLAVLFTLGAAYGSYRLIEVPGRWWLRKRLGSVIATMFRSPGGASRGGH